MFCSPKYIQKYETETIRFNKTKICGNVLPWMLDSIKRMEKQSEEGILCDTLTVVPEIPEYVSKQIPSFDKKSGGFILKLGKESFVYAESDGIHAAFATLEQLNVCDEMHEMLLWDYPIVPMRGFRTFVPARNEIDAFKKFIDALEYYRYNTVILEVGGAMEYKNHPEINEGWVEYCKEMRSYTGKSIEVQYLTYDWGKNAIHADNCKGEFLTQNEIRELLKYCKERGMNVIPEMPSLSHCDYMLTRHPELKERTEDPYPDCYCPLNEDSYALLFDLLEEVIDVFKPEYVNIGHDELYSIGVCDKCKDRIPAELFSNDIIKIYDFLKERNIKTMMWCDKLFEVHLPDGNGECGSEIHRFSSKNKVEYIIPETFTARDLLPKDIVMINWQTPYEEQEEILLDYGFPMVYGNFELFRMKNWKKRINDRKSGGFISNWGSMGKQELQRNGIVFKMVSSSMAFWEKDLDNKDFQTFFEKTCNEVHRYMTAGIKNKIVITHTTDCLMKNYVFYDGVFIEDAMWHMGDYVVKYKDGTTALLPVRYGYEISSRNLWYSGANPAVTGSVGNAIPEKVPAQEHHPVFYNTPFLYNPPKEKTDETVDYALNYTCVYENPFAEKDIENISFVANPEWKSEKKDDNPLIYNETVIVVKISF